MARRSSFFNVESRKASRPTGCPSYQGLSKRLTLSMKCFDSMPWNGSPPRRLRKCSTSAVKEDDHGCDISSAGWSRTVPFYLPAQSGKVASRLLLEQQLNLVLETHNTSRGLVVRISDLLFHFDDFTLTPEAREKLAKIAGILSAYGGVCPCLEGYTDNVGSDEYNLQLSRKRADAVRVYLISQGVPPANLTAAGFVSTNPAAPNATAAGRERNRRVEMLIPGDVIGITVTSAAE